MSLELILKKLFKKKSKTRSHHKFPLKDSTFRDKDLIEGIKVILSKNMTMSDITKKFEKLFSKDLKTSYSTMVNSGSSANLLAIQCLINPYRKRRRSTYTGCLLANFFLANYTKWFETSFCRC